ncbi:MAG: hypothetical protein R3300_21195 [Candidatus Promineifilaceae bacterium]|nr:hypothetical protein [Candidatus Promineifilaceae bacterium]
MSEQVKFEANEGRLKVTVPIEVNPFLVALFTIALIAWLGMLILVGQFLFDEATSNFVLTVLVLIWLLIWLWFGRFLWRRWQYYAASREILFIDDEQLILRRPLSLLGSTTVYDRSHLSPFYVSERHDCPAFDYAYLHVYFGQSLNQEAARQLVDDLNRRFFPRAIVGEESE